MLLSMTREQKTPLYFDTTTNISEDFGSLGVVLVTDTFKSSVSGWPNKNTWDITREIWEEGGGSQPNWWDPKLGGATVGGI